MWVKSKAPAALLLVCCGAVGRCRPGAWDTKGFSPCLHAGSRGLCCLHGMLLPKSWAQMVEVMRAMIAVLMSPHAAHAPYDT